MEYGVLVFRFFDFRNGVQVEASPKGFRCKAWLSWADGVSPLTEHILSSDEADVDPSSFKLVTLGLSMMVLRSVEGGRTR